MGSESSLDDITTPKENMPKHTCTDIPCCVVFVLFLGVYAVLGFIVFYNSDVSLLLHPSDSFGNVCGVSPGVARKPYLFFFDPTACASIGVSVDSFGLSLCPTIKICVSECPTSDFYYLPDVGRYNLNPQSIDYDRYICVYGVDPAGKDPSTLIGQEECAPYYLASEDLMGYCVPKVIADITSNAANLNSQGELEIDGKPVNNTDGETITKSTLIDSAKNIGKLFGAQEKVMNFFEDIIEAKWILLAFAVVTVVVSLIVMLGIQFFASIIVWLLILVSLVLFGCAAAFSILKYRDLKAQEQAAEASVDEFVLTTNIVEYGSLSITWLVLSVVTSLLFVVTLLVTLFSFNRIRLAIELLVEASKAVLANLTAILLPILTFVLMTAVLAYGVAVTIWIMAYDVRKESMNSSGNSNFTVCKEKFISTGNQDDFQDAAECAFQFVGGDGYVKIMHLVNVFAVLWLVFFVMGLGQCALAGIFSDWYWSRGEIGFLPVTRNISRTLFYHTGSIAFGSFLIAFVTLVRLLIEYAERKFKEYQNDMVKFMLKVLKCLVWCIEKLLKFISKNAYIIVASYSKSFCSAALEACRLLTSNCVRVVILNGITFLIMVLCQLVIVGIMGYLSYVVFVGSELSQVWDFMERPELTYYFSPIIVIVIGAFCISRLFFDVYDMAVDTLFICALEDLEHNDGSAEKPYAMSKDLQRILGTKNKYEEQFDNKAEDNM